ncbi:hypothetical protein MFERI13461_00131 [Mycoplasma feriruminatoris]|uniref:DUF2357 domain-containing protein n=1 Tax=Mycoplasma feriruminatoris TaxID=1179777 RepID=A0ABY8HUE4_9MOLU|nr:hypothetical protein [Mycoplasma feriruminatoris]WFQ89902.1 hypothetical protein MFERI11561_00127 [Mycoplasma feriruminatoris]WFQ90723.1 hypothetical protein MFERI13461_00131 [Mycoplasma feriruminatoris]WFQ93239.1 hypothetical protein MFERI15181_00130 [Mycoplasma feriruminatoris]WFQ95722.1 hypothetical protein MFERI15568_00129 [Mycoplasma feriruminatoris]
MSYKIKELTFRSKKATLNKVDLVVDDGQIVDIVIDNKEQMDFFKKVLLGKKKNNSGRFQIDDFDIINRAYTRKHVEFIKRDTWFQRTIPSKWILVLSLLFDQSFLRSAADKYIEKKYEYLSLVASKGEANDKRLRQNIDNLISKHINTKIREEQKALNSAISEQKKRNQEKFLAIPEQWPIQIRLLYKARENLEAEIRTATLMLMFQQNLWDNIYTLNELRDNCSCEYNAKHSSNKRLKKNWKKFAYKQTYYAVNKQLRVISTKIADLRISIFSKKRKLNQFDHQIWFEFKKYFKSLLALEEYKSKKRFTWTEQDEMRKYFVDWRNANENSLNEIEKNQRELFIDPIRQTTQALGGEINFLIHQYHERVLSDELEYLEKHRFAMQKKQKKKEIKSVFKQAVEQMSTSVDKYNIKFEWFVKSSVKYLSLNIVYLKILKAINLKKKNIIFSNITKHLSEKELLQLLETIKRIQENHPFMTFIFLNDSISDVYNLDKNIYFVNNKLELKELSTTDIFDILLKRQENNINKISYKKISENQIKILNDSLWVLTNYDLKNSGFISFNPLKISPDINNSSDLLLEVKIIKSKKFIDKSMWCGITNDKQKIYFYDKKESYMENDVALIAINKNAISNVN